LSLSFDIYYVRKFGARSKWSSIICAVIIIYMLMYSRTPSADVMSGSRGRWMSVVAIDIARFASTPVFAAPFPFLATKRIDQNGIILASMVK